MSGEGETELEPLGAKVEETGIIPPSNGPPEDGLGDDEELAIGGKVAGIRQGPVVETTTKQDVTNTMTQNVVAVGPSMQMVLDPNMANYG